MLLAFHVFALERSVKFIQHLGDIVYEFAIIACRIIVESWNL